MKRQDLPIKIGNKNNHNFYIDVIKKYGVSHQGVHWQSKYTQYKRFEVLTDFIQKDIKTSTIIDAGCGFGEYYEFLDKCKNLPKEYEGIDIEEEMLIFARKRFKHINFQKKDILKDELLIADYYVCSGAMNILEKEEMFLFIKNCFEASNKGFVFNFLKKYSFNNVSSSDILSYCKLLTKNIGINNNYLENDISIFLKK